LAISRIGFCTVRRIGYQTRVVKTPKKELVTI
jgi:hypothetical protein